MVFAKHDKIEQVNLRLRAMNALITHNLNDSTGVGGEGVPPAITCYFKIVLVLQVQGNT